MKSIERIEEAIAQTMQAWGLPGVGVALVAGDEVYARGFGVCTAGKAEPVTEQTVFAIGSTTKAFTSAACAMLVDDGKLAWDDPVVKHLPDFGLYDPWVSQNVTLRDLLCHRLGLERAQRLYYHGGYSQAEIIRRMRFLRPVAGFRTQFHYANQQYGAAGLMLEAASGQSWDDFITQRIFEPAGMTRSFSSYIRTEGLDGLAQPHAVLEETYPAGVRFLGEQKPIPWFKLNHEPAGSILTSAADLAKWLGLMLKGGNPLIKPDSFAELTNPQMVMQNLPESELAPLYFLQPPTSFWTYGMGWWVLDHAGYKILMHGGQMPGFNSVVAFVPQAGIGIAVMVNVHQTLAHAALFYDLLEILLDRPGRKWGEEIKQVAQGYMAQVKAGQDQAIAARQAGSGPAAPLAAYSGVFSSDLFGEVSVSLEDGRLVIRYGQIWAELVHWQANTFLAQWNLKGLLEDSLIEFSADANTLAWVNDGIPHRRK